jgi:uncharacterized membrane protein YkgB
VKSEFRIREAFLGPILCLQLAKEMLDTSEIETTLTVFEDRNYSTEFLLHASESICFLQIRISFYLIFGEHNGKCIKSNLKNAFSAMIFIVIFAVTLSFNINFPEVFSQQFSTIFIQICERKTCR